MNAFDSCIPFNVFLGVFFSFFYLTLSPINHFVFGARYVLIMACGVSARLKVQNKPDSMGEREMVDRAIDPQNVLIILGAEKTLSQSFRGSAKWQGQSKD